MTLRAVVVGGGIGGTAAAVALARAGIDVQLYEQARELTEVGAGVSLAPNGLRMLDRLGVSREALRRQLEESIGHGPGGTYGPVRFSRPRGQKVLTSALPEALAQGTTDICTAHLLLAQYHDDGLASRTLAGLGATEDRVRDTVRGATSADLEERVTRRARAARV